MKARLEGEFVSSESAADEAGVLSLLRDMP